MTFIYHFANPDIVKIILLIDFIVLIFGGLHLRIKRGDIKWSSLFILGGLLSATWYIIFFFIPAIMFTTPPTPLELQFINDYIFIWHKLVPGLVLLISLGVDNIVIGLMNKENYGVFLIISGVLLSISIVLTFFDSMILSLITSIIMGISLIFFLYFSIKIKVPFLVIFCIIYLFSMVFPLIMPDHYIILF